jgi:hypothetical protein
MAKTETAQHTFFLPEVGNSVLLSQISASKPGI